MRSQTFCFSGHRAIPAHDLPKIRQRSEELIRMLLGRGYCYAIVGGALGYDFMALQLLLRLKQEFRQLQVFGVFPYPGYDVDWTDAQRDEHAALLPQLDEVVYIMPANASGSKAFLARNREMVDRSSVLICYYDERRSRSGTGQCFRYAQHKSLRVFNTAG